MSCISAHRADAHVLHVDDRLGVFQHLRPQVRVRLRKRRRRALSDHRQFRLRRRHRRARRQPSEDPQYRTRTARRRRRVHAERYPILMVHRKREALGHHADDRVVGGPEPDLLPKDGGVLPEARLPDVVADDDHPRRRVALIFGREKPSEQRGHPRHAKPARTHRRDAHHFRQPIARLQRRDVVLKRADLDDGRHLIPPGHEVVERLLILVVLRDVPVLERDDAVPFVERQRGRQQSRGGSRTCPP